MVKQPKEIFRKHYATPSYWIKNVELDFHVFDGETKVYAKLFCERNAKGNGGNLALNGESVKLLELKIDGKPLTEASGGAATSYSFDEDERLVIPEAALPKEAGKPFVVETAVSIVPENNTLLQGLYKSGAMYSTQCEAEGFRRITYFLDRPDVMSVYKVRVEASTAYPVLISNGNKTEEGKVGADRHYAVYVDKHPKPCYLFAVVAGDLKCIQDSFKTMSGKKVDLVIYSEAHNVQKLDWAMSSIKKAMKWDEEAFGREYDLDIFNIVAVDDFNMGAMENKSLNIFNTALVLASPETASDDDYLRILGVVGHEYFHNWTGNRVTCRDWFQLTLKEGLTVFRDQQFSRAMGSPAVKRIEDIIMLRSRQFAEDAGPMQHPIRPESYIAMDNFYTSTVYNKGAEVIRMYHTKLGGEGFRKGMDLYFQRHDGCAVTCDDFRAAMADANGYDLSQFEAWYKQPGTPVVEVLAAKWNPLNKTYTIKLKQGNPNNKLDVKGPMDVPIRIGLLRKSDGKEILANTVLDLTEEVATFVIVGVNDEPVPSLLRDFSAPVTLVHEYSDEDLAFLMAYDTDDFNRWEAAQKLSTRVIMAAYLKMKGGAKAADCASLSPSFVAAFRRVLQALGIDRSLQAYALRLPDEKTLEGEAVTRGGLLDPEALHQARNHVRLCLAKELRVDLQATYDALSKEAAAAGPKYEVTGAAVGRRRLRNTCLTYMGLLQDGDVAKLALQQFTEANNMTDKMAALYVLNDIPGAERETALGQFHKDAKGDALVLNKWFLVQTQADLPDLVDRVEKLMTHPDFQLKNPNRCRSVLMGFTMNQSKFHSIDGKGYALLTKAILEVDKINGIMAGRLATSLIDWRKYDEKRQVMMKEKLVALQKTPGLSAELFEIVEKGLK